VPLGDPFQPEFRFFGFRVRHLVDERGQFFERAVAFFQSRHKALADESGNEGLEFQPGGIDAEFAVNLALHRTQFFQGSQPNAHGSHADSDPVGDFFHDERNGRTEEEAVDLPVGAGIAKEIRQLGKDRDQALLKALPIKGSALGILDDGF